MATSIGPKTSLFSIFFIVLLFSFLSLLLNTKKTLFFPIKGILCLFLSFSLCFSLAFFGLPLFLFLFLCLSLSLSLSLLFLSFFSFLSFFFAFFWFLFLSLSFLFFLLCFFFHERNNNILNCNFFLHQYFLMFWFPVLFFLSNPFFLSLLFPDFKLCFLFNINAFGFKTNNLTKQKCLVKKGVATKQLFL